ncbi:MAG: choice-of-anchor Q domain-containing protein [Gammaproteobacteria bacterium]
MVSLQPGPASAATFNVPDGDVAGLIAAITTANANGQANVIDLAPGGTYTLTAVDNTHFSTGPSGLPWITGRIILNGNGATIERSTAAGTPDFRIFAIAAGGDLTLSEVTIRGGRAASGAPGFPGGGGGVRIDMGVLLLMNSTVTGNFADEGGGVFNFVGGTLTVVNSTISHNTGFGLRTGGGILNLSTPDHLSRTIIINSTIFENRADGPPGFQGRGDAIADGFSGPGGIVVKNSILASPTQGLGGDCFGIAPGVLTSAGHNIASDTSCPGLTGGSDLTGTDPLLGPLADHGGPTHTHATLSGSPAVNAVPLTECTDVGGVPIATDQRGVARPQGAACDVGAYETSNQSPLAHAGPDQTVEAASPSGALVTLDGSRSSDPDGDPLVYAWTGPFGMVSGVSPTVAFPLGAHAATLTVNDGQATTVDRVTIIVRDTTPPETLIASAVDGNGSAVASGGSTLSRSMTFAFQGTDAVGVVGFQCSLGAAAFASCSSPIRYSVLTAGSQRFRVRALDAAGHVDPSPAGVAWTVVTPAQAAQNLIAMIDGMGLPRGVENNLSAPLDRIVALLTDRNPRNDDAACRKLNAFIDRVNDKLRRGRLTAGQASQLLPAANAIKASLDC